MSIYIVFTNLGNNVNLFLLSPFCKGIDEEIKINEKQGKISNNLHAYNNELSIRRLIDVRDQLCVL